MSTDSGEHWREGQVPGAESLDFRSVFAFSAQHAYLLSSGEADKSKLFESTDGGQQWSLLFTAKEGFLDGVKFWDPQNGIILGDVVGGVFTILTTANAGRTWNRQNLPPALPDEGAFAASNSSLFVRGKSEAWFGTSGARVFHSRDGGRSWTVAQTPMRHDAKSAGIFSLFFKNDNDGIAVGGDYTMATDNLHNIALTSDGGKTWTEPASRPGGYRSSVVCSELTCTASGPDATDVSTDGGLSWNRLSEPGFHALSLAGGAIFASGSGGRLQKLSH